MTETMFEEMAQRLKAEIAKEITYSYAVFVPKGTERVISNMKKNIPLKDRKFLERDLQISVGKDLIFPYDVLNSNLEKYISDFYDEIKLSSKTAKALAGYGNRGKLFEKEFNERVRQSKESLTSAVKHELNLKMMQNKDAKSAVAHIQKVLTKRLTSLESFLKDSAGQLKQYMVLWDYQDKGYTHYRLKANGDTCEKCSELSGRVFPIYGAEPGETLMPLHPNCDCSIEVLDKNGNAIAVSDERKTESEKSEESLEYLQTSLKQVILGNYTDDTNLLGTLGQLLLGLLGFDLPADVRDFAYDVTNFEMSSGHILQTLLDALAFIPVVGAFKYTDETVDVLKSAAKYGDEAAETVKATTKTGITEKVTKHGAERLHQRGFSQDDILNTKMTSNIKTQSDGAKVYIKEVDNGRFDIIVEGDRGIITALRNISKKSLERLTKNYNWR